MVIEITGVTSGTSPYNIFICDSNNIGCFFVSGVTTFPPSVIFDTDNFFPNETSFYLKIIDGAICEKLYLVSCPVDTFFILTETGLIITTESGDRLVWGIPS